MREVKDRLAELAVMSPAQLRAEWQRLVRQPPPPISPDLLRREIAYRLQEAASGGLTRQVSRELADIRKRIVQGSSPLPASAGIAPTSTITRHNAALASRTSAQPNGNCFRAKTLENGSPRCAGRSAIGVPR